MDREIKNKIVAITGGADGIGLAIADKFLENEAKVVIILDINEKKGEDSTNSLNSKYGKDKAIFIKCDVSSDLEKVYNKILSTYKHIDVLVNNAGVSDEINIRHIIGINLIAVMEWTMKFWEYMRTDKGGKGGHIINMASIYGYRVDPFLPFYKASKYGVMGFTKTLGHEFGFKKSGVRVIALCPGFTATTLLGTADNLPLQEYFEEFVGKEVTIQSPDVVGEGAMVVFKKAESGTAWLIEHGQPIKEV